jgi:DNA polymerase III delta prime subunit
LLVLKLHAEQLIDLHSLSFLNGEKSFSIINALIAGREKKLCPVLDTRVEANNVVSQKIKRLQRLDKFIFEERGSNDLHIGWPFIRGKFADGTLVRCPLLFFPVAIEEEDRNWVIRLRKDAGITFNKSFLLAYAFYNKIKLDEDLLDTTFDDLNVDSTVFRTEVYQILKDKIEINFNPDNFRDELGPFQEFKKEEFEESHRNESLKLIPEAVLGIFPQAGSQLVPDYLQLLEDETIEDLEGIFHKKNIADPEMSASAVREEKIYTPFPLDAYQEQAIRAIKSGNSIVVQGPPGTGKSQLIANLLADAIASGKRALLVCQKRAALDVVYERLKKIELGDFLGLVHDFRNDRKDIFAKIERQINHIDDFKAKNRSVDSIQMERRFFQASRAIDQITDELEQFKSALFDISECGVTVKELYLTSDPHSNTINVRQEYQHFNLSDSLEIFLRKIKSYAQYAAVVDREEHPWHDRKSFSSYRVSDLRLIEETIRHVGESKVKLSQFASTVLNTTLTIDEADALRIREDDILAMMALLKEPATFDCFRRLMDVPDDETSLLWFTNLERVALSCFDSHGVESTIAGDELGRFQEALHERMRARKSLIRGLRWKFSDKKALFERVLESNKLADNKEGLAVLEARLDNRLNLEHHLTTLKKKEWLSDIPLDYDFDKLKAWFETHKLAMRAKRTFRSLTELKNGVDPHAYSQKEFLDLFRKLLDMLMQTVDWRREWLCYLTPYQIRHLVVDTSLQSHYIEMLRRDFDILCEFDRLIESLKQYEKDIIQRLNEAVGWHYPLMENLFQNSIRLAWIDHIEAKYPVLRSVTSGKMNEMQNELQQRIAEKQKLSIDILLMRARERVYEHIAYNRLNNRVTYRDLSHQVTKKKKIWPLRKVIGDFSDEIFQLLPCWLASPESVSAIFPLTELFDLVIFDEASQCFAERGIPSIYRSKQVLVAGDDMQLKPSELYQVRWEENGEHPDLEIESLLDLVKRYMPTVHLQGHYRSKSLELIDFSNRHFYANRLQVLPDRKVISNGMPAIEYIKVEGLWENNVNEVEAREVVSKVIEIIRSTPDAEIGVVTFNAPQQMLIMDLLEEEYARIGRAIPHTIFVKNIENVQGDERDVIIFSTGYAPDKKGKMNMQFGSFSLIGGENRLNVAVTRARERIIIVSSIYPEQLRVDDVKNEGPRLLKKYLEFARTVHQREFHPQPTSVPRKLFSDYLNEKLKQWAAAKFVTHQVHINTLPFSDIHLTKDGKYLGVILTDDSRYMSSGNIKDSHAYTYALLQNKNWEFHTVFSRNYWFERERTENDLTRFIGSKN